MLKIVGNLDHNWWSNSDKQSLTTTLPTLVGERFLHWASSRVFSKSKSWKTLTTSQHQTKKSTPVISLLERSLSLKTKSLISDDKRLLKSNRGKSRLRPKKSHKIKRRIENWVKPLSENRRRRRTQIIKNT